MTQPGNGQLKKTVGIPGVIANVLNICIGSGAFLFPALLYGIMGNASIIAYVLCGFLFLMVVLCYMEISSRITDTGGSYAYIEKTFGPFAGFLANILFWLGIGTLAAAALVNGLAGMLAVAFPVLSAFHFKILIFIGAFFLSGYINILGIREGIAAVKILTLMKAVPLVLLTGIGLFHIRSANLQWTGFPGFDKLGAASLLLFFAFAGGDSALNISGEMKNPRRTAPLGLLIGTLFIIVFFCLMQVVALGVMGSELVNYKEAPLAEMAGRLSGNAGFSILIVAAMVSIFGTLNSVILLFPRIIYAGARNKLFPAYFSAVHPKYSTPHRSIAIFCFISFIIAITGSYRQLAVLVTASTILLYIGVVLAVIRLRLKKDEEPPVFKLPGGLIIPVITLITLGWFLTHLTREELTGIGAFILIISLIYAAGFWIKNIRNTK